MINDERHTQNEVMRPTAEEMGANTDLLFLNDVEFYENGVRQNVRDVRRFTVVRLRPLRNIPAGAELFNN